MEHEAVPVDWESRLAYIRSLAEVVQAEQLSEVTVEDGGVTVTLKSPAAIAAVAPTYLPAGAEVAYGVAPAGTAPVAAPADADPAKADANLYAVEAPMVGVFYRAPSPGEPNFVEEGDTVEAGQVVGLMEAMKVFNDITTEEGGVVAKIEARNGELVETGNPLLYIRTS